MTRLLPLLLLGCLSSASATTFSVTSYYTGVARNATPYFVLVQEYLECASEMRAVGDDTDKTLVECSSNYVDSVGRQFGSTPYIFQVQFDNAECTKFSSGVGVPVSDECEGSSDLSFTNASMGRITVNGSASIQWFSEPQCKEDSWLRTDIVDAKTLKSHSCDGNWRKWYSSSSTRRLATTSDSSTDGNVTPDVGSTSTSASNTEDAATNSGSSSSGPTTTNSGSTVDSGSSSSQGSGSNFSSRSKSGSGVSEVEEGSSSGSKPVSDPSGSGISIGVIIAIAGGCIAFILIICAILLCRRRLRGKDESTLQQTETTQYTDMTSPKGKSRGQTGLWDDDVITAKRISRDEVQVCDLISRGGNGEVYAGAFHGRAVAIKMLPPATRAEIKHVNEFLAEAKMAATMDHPRIVSLVGVAWNALSDLCVVFEYMDGGDLRTLLDKYEHSGHPIGIDYQKATIAVHVCHALTYLHSLMPSVIHRDLKSRNVLLSRRMDAKLTDFGISRERLDVTMTAGVGTSLWMAPEVMMGERYDDKADIFSLGVLLSELDVHSIPYAHVKTTMSDAVLLHQIVVGKVHVAFSQFSPREFWDLGHACTSVDPRDRPTAAEALYRLQMILANLENSQVVDSRASYVF
ncbi:TKL protein kinase [Phytophthora nicotianae]|uniref:TKL protein kinase n=2 Tax=Phytophthora nicotianae TaxID=4792 RepID=V9ECI8_PHYNI|nr:TKL protein kinase [Phytophthora nicotianae P1569]ETL83714.1 TKL protein kinase [Phytophthora nicotianae]ETM36918.1 TKL protein kinase [Phytophthora nicotianae]